MVQFQLFIFHISKRILHIILQKDNDTCPYPKCPSKTLKETSWRKNLENYQTSKKHQMKTPNFPLIKTKNESYSCSIIKKTTSKDSFPKNYTIIIYI